MCVSVQCGGGGGGGGGGGEGAGDSAISTIMFYSSMSIVIKPSGIDFALDAAAAADDDDDDQECFSMPEVGMRKLSL